MFCLEYAVAFSYADIPIQSQGRLRNVKMRYPLIGITLSRSLIGRAAWEI